MYSSDPYMEHMEQLYVETLNVENERMCECCCNTIKKTSVLLVQKLAF